MNELLDFLNSTYNKFSDTELKEKSIRLTISREDLQMIIESIVKTIEIKTIQSESANLNKEIKTLQDSIKTKDTALELLAQQINKQQHTFEGYKEAVKDILGGDLNV